MTRNTAQQPSFDAGHVPMSEEMDSMRRTLPPIILVIIAFAVVGIVLAVYLLTTHSRPSKYTGSVIRAVVFPVHVESSNTGDSGFRELDTTVEKRDQVVILVQMQLKNESEKSIYVKGISSTLSAASGKPEDDIEDQAAPAGDYLRIFQAYPALAAYQAQPVAPETKLDPGAQASGAEIFSFQMPLEQFQKSKALTVNVNLYDHNPVLLTVQPSQVEAVSAPAVAQTTSKERKK